MKLPHLLSTIVLAASAASGTAVAAVQVDEAWVDRLDGPASMNDYGEAIAIGSDGSIYVAGLVFEQVQSNLFAPRFITIRYDAGGARMWTRTYAGTFASGAAAAQHVAVDVNGDIVVSGSTNQGEDWAVLKYDAAGNELWQHVYEANSTFLTEPEDMALDAAGNIYLVGYVGDALNPNAGALVKVTPAGAPAWERRYYGPTFDGAVFNAVACDADGNVYAAGSAVVPDRASELCVVKYDAAGTEQWLATDGSISSFAHDRATELAVDAAGDIVAVGLFGSNSPTGIDLVAAKFDASGTKLWRKLYIGPAARDDVATAVAIDGADNIVVVGYSGVDVGDYDALTLKYDAAGTLLWERHIAGDEIHFDWATSVAIDDQDNVYVCGEYDPIGGARFFTVRYDPDGTQAWLADYAGPMGGGSRANDVAVGADGSVHVTGESPGASTQLDIATIRYEQAGDVMPGDLDGNGTVDIVDLVALLAAWGPCANCADCPADLDGDCAVTLGDLLALLANWT